MLARIAKPGTQIIEVRVIPVFAKNADVSAAALTLILARDPSTDTWWIVQFYILDVYALRTVKLNRHLI